MFSNGLTYAVPRTRTLKAYYFGRSLLKLKLYSTVNTGEISSGTFLSTLPNNYVRRNPSYEMSYAPP